MNTEDLELETDWDDPVWTVTAYVNQARAGRCCCVKQENNDLLFSDITVYAGDQLMPKRPFWKRLLGMKIESPNFRGRGIGNQLLHTVLAQAKKKQVKRIYGTIVRSDYEVSTFLPTWYQENGFNLVRPDEECVGDAVYKVEMYL